MTGADAAGSRPAPRRDADADHVEGGDVGSDAGRLRSIGFRELMVRFGFGAAVSMAAGLIGLAEGDRAGGVLLAFPAILPAALTLIESKEGTSTAVSDVRGAVAGALGMVAFALAVLALAGRIPTLLALLLAAVAWVSISAALYFAGIGLARVLGEEQYLPDVAVAEASPAANALRAAGLTVAVAESCSGGVLTALLTAVRGASEVTPGGIVAYSDEAKRDLLDVPAEVLEREGAVSEAAARAMADGVRRRLGTDVGLAVTGITGSPAEGKSPGLVFVAAVGPAGVRVTRIQGDRGPEATRGDAVRAALKLCGEVMPRNMPEG
ncbi:MAG: CinA family protein [Chloroflexi bacterium]|nr:MAG: CinA family protein [Chloroflexota bacterium]